MPALTGHLSRRQVLTVLCAGSVSSLLAACGGAATITAATSAATSATAASTVSRTSAAQQTAQAASATAGSAPTASPTTAMVTTATSSTASAAAAAPAAGQTVVSYWHIWGGVRTKQLQGIFDTFSKANPSIKVDPTLVPNPGYQDKLTAIMASDPPDATMAYSDVYAPFVKQEALQRVDARMQKDKISPTAWYDSIWNLTLWKEVPYGLPEVGNFLYLLYWNTDLFRAVGLDPQTGPATWSATLDATRRLTVLQGTSLSRMGYAPSTNDFLTAVYNNGAAILDPLTGKSKLNDPRAAAAMDYAVQLVKIQGGEAAVADASKAFKNAQLDDPLESNKAAMITSGVFTINIIKQQTPKLNYRVGPIPHGPDGQTTDLATGSWNNTLPVHGKHPDQAWELVKYLSYGDGQKDFMFLQARPAMVKKYNEPPYDAAYRKDNPFWDAILQELNRTVSYPLIDTIGKITTQIGVAYQKAVSASMSANDAVAWLDTQITAIEQAQA